MPASSLALVAAAAATLSSAVTDARFASPAAYRAHPGATTAITYDASSVPVGSQARIVAWHNKWGGMSVGLRVGGLKPDERYDAQVHVGACTDRPDGAGRRFQNNPRSGSYAANEFRFDFRTDARGDARALAVHYWGIAKGQHAGSVVIEAHGSAEPAACVTVPFWRLPPD